MAPLKAGTAFILRQPSERGQDMSLLGPLFGWRLLSLLGSRLEPASRSFPVGRKRVPRIFDFAVLCGCRVQAAVFGPSAVVVSAVPWHSNR